MATSAKHLSRKELREPDRFMVFTQQALGFIKERRLLVIVTGVLMVTALLAISAWQIYKSRQNELAAQYFDSAITLFRASKYKEALPEFAKVQGYRWSHYAALAHLYEANSYLATNDLDRATAAAQRFVASTDPNSTYRQIGLITLGHVEELKTQCRDAIRHYTEAERITGALKESAVLGKARCYTAIGDNQSAIAAYQQYVQENPNSPIAARLVLQVAELQSAQPQSTTK